MRERSFSSSSTAKGISLVVIDTRAPGRARGGRQRQHMRAIRPRAGRDLQPRSRFHQSLGQHPGRRGVIRQTLSQAQGRAGDMRGGQCA